MNNDDDLENKDWSLEAPEPSEDDFVEDAGGVDEPSAAPPGLKPDQETQQRAPRPFKSDEFIDNLSEEDALEYARDMGWRENPVDKNGNPKEAKSPRDFLKDSPGTKDRILQRRILNNLTEKLSTLTAAQERAANENYLRGLEEGKRNLKNEFDGAVETGDVEKAEALLARRVELEKKEAEARTDYEASLSSFDPIVQQTRGALEIFQQRNPWFENNPALTAYAKGLMHDHRRMGMSTVDAIELAEIKINKELGVESNYNSGGRQQSSPDRGRAPTDMGGGKGRSVSPAIKRSVANLKSETRNIYNSLFDEIDDPHEKAELTKRFISGLEPDHFI